MPAKRSRAKRKPYNWDPPRDLPVARQAMTARESAVYLGVTLRWMHHQAKAHGVPRVKVGGQIRYLRADLDAWLESNREPAEQ